MKNFESTKGITLIALVITIIVLLILAAVSLSAIFGENGILIRSTNAKIKHIHGVVDESMQLEYANYITDKRSKKTTLSLIEYLKDKGIIGNITEDGWYVINPEELMGAKQEYGNGTDGKTDVYVLQAQDTDMKYNVVYYGENSEEPVVLGALSDFGSSENEKASIDWDKAKEEATEPHPEQTQSGDIGIGTDGELVNLDYWVYGKENGTIKLGLNYGSWSDEVGYIFEIRGGKIVGKIPQYIKLAGTDEWLPVTDIKGGFRGISDLEIAPEIPSTVTIIGSYMFRNCVNLKSVEIPSNVTRIEGAAFYGCSSLESIEIPDSVTEIDYYAFRDCKSLTSIVIPKSVTIADYDIFRDCDNLKTIYCEAESKPSGWRSDWNDGCSAEVVWGYKGD